MRLTILDLGNGQGWGGLAGADAGTVTFTTVPGAAGNRAIGTFSGSLGPVGFVGAPLVVTGGTFDVRINSP